MIRIYLGLSLIGTTDIREYQVSASESLVADIRSYL